MSVSIVQRTVDSETDKRISISNFSIGREISIGTSWNKIRIAVRLSTTRTTAWTGAPRFYFGLSSGTTAMPGSVTPNHFFGIVNQTANWTTTTGGIIWGSTTTSWADAIKIGGGTAYDTQGVGRAGNTPKMFSVADGRSLIILEIEKGATWNFNMVTTIQASGSATLAGFRDALDIPTLADNGFFLVQGSAYTATATDEATYGDLNTICFSWLGATDSFEISDIAYARLS